MSSYSSNAYMAEGRINHRGSSKAGRRPFGEETNDLMADSGYSRLLQALVIGAS